MCHVSAEIHTRQSCCTFALSLPQLRVTESSGKMSERKARQKVCGDLCSTEQEFGPQEQNSRCRRRRSGIYYDGRLCCTWRGNHLLGRRWNVFGDPAVARVQLQMSGEVRAVRESLAARRARIRPRSAMDPGVAVQVAAVLETFAANVTDKRPPVRMDSRVLHKVSVRVETLPTHLRTSPAKLLLLLLKKDMYRPTYNKLERPGITESIKSLRRIKMNVKIISVEESFTTVLVIHQIFPTVSPSRGNTQHRSSKKG